MLAAMEVAGVLCHGSCVDAAARRIMRTRMDHVRSTAVVSWQHQVLLVTKALA